MADEEGTPEAKPVKVSGPVQRGVELRRLLIRKLPTVDAKRAEGQIAVEPGALEVEADAFIEPLQALTGRRP